MSEEINRGFADFKLTWKENGVKREAHLTGNFSETEIVRTFCMLVNVNGLPDSSWLSGYAAGREEGVNATRLEYARKMKGGKK